MARSNPVTAKDVADLAGVSRSAVSRTFTPGASVSAKTRMKVEEAARRLSYSPNLIARSLITRRSGIVGLVLSQMDNPFYAALVDALGEKLAASGKRLMLFSGTEGPRVEQQIEALLHYRVEALMIASVTPSSALLQRCREAGVRVILINRSTDEADCCTITCDNEDGGYQIGRQMLAEGCRRLAFVAGVEASSTSREREKGFSRAISQAGGQLVARACGDYDAAVTRAAARRILALAEPPDGIFCANDLMALAFLDVAHCEFGLTAGHDFALYGFDDIALASWQSFRLATFSQPVIAMVTCAVEMLHSADTGTGQRVVLPGRLIERESGRLSAVRRNPA